MHRHRLRLDRIRPHSHSRRVASTRIIESDFRYEIVRKIFEGGMGIVYEAKQLGARGFSKRVAIKVIRERFARQPEFIENFIGEARLVADLIHTNIVQTYHLAEDRGTWFICMEYIRGVNLDELMTRLRQTGRALPTELAVFIVSRIARGLAYAHAKTDPEGRPLGIVHRDISPKNIMIAYEGDVKVTDFGIAKARGFLIDKEGEEVAGKPEYMSPEQADFKITDKRSDLFSAGVVLAQLLTGTNFLRADTPEASRERVLTAPIPDFQAINPAIETRLNQILQRALHRDLALRYQSADEFLYELEHFIYHRGYGPTNETMGRFLRQVCESASPGDAAGGTARLTPAGSAAKVAAAGTSRTTRASHPSVSTRTTRTTRTRKVTKARNLVERIKSHLK